MGESKIWSYTILSNNIARRTHGALHDILLASFTLDEINKLSETFSDETRIRKYIKKCYDTLVSYAFKTESRVGFQALGVFLMEYGSKMTNDLKKLILKYSKWKDERKQLKNKKDRIERKKYLFDFNEKILKYKPGNKVKVPDKIMVHIKEKKRLVNDTTPIWRQNIDHNITNLEEDLKEYFNLKSTEFKINNLITLKLEGGKTFIYINNRKVIICKHVLINVPINKSIEFRSNDEFIEKSTDHSYNIQDDLTLIPIDLEFWVHCSNMQVWAENKYDSGLLHSNLSFPLLKELIDVNDPIAKKSL